MQEPSLSSYGLSEADIQRWNRPEKPGPTLLSNVLGGVGALCGAVLGIANAGDLGGAIYGGWFGLLAGSATALCVEGLLPKFHPRRKRYAEFKAAMSAWEAQARRRQEEARKERERPRREFWRSLSGHEFERELAAWFERQGYRAEVTPGSGDQGVDIVLQRSGKTTVVQCKQTKSPVSPAVARELYGALVAWKATDGILAATGGVTSGVHKFFQGKPLRVMELDEILSLQAKAGTADTPRSGLHRRV